MRSVVPCVTMIQEECMRRKISLLHVQRAEAASSNPVRVVVPILRVLEGPQAVDLVSL